MDKDIPLENLLDSAIPVLSNGVILRLMEAGFITIDPFDPEKLAPTAYQLCPHRLRFRNEDEEGLGPIDKIFYLAPETMRQLRPGEYAVVSPREKIVLKEGLVADFYPSSWCAEHRLLLTAGRLDANYNYDLVFGIFNAGRDDVDLQVHTHIARVTFGWLGYNNMPIYKGGPPPGAYIPQLAQLRAREEALNTAEDALRAQREELAKLRDDLITRSNQKT